MVRRAAEILRFLEIRSPVFREARRDLGERFFRKV